MARYRRTLRVVVNGLAVLSMLLGGTLTPGAAAAPVAGRSVTAEIHASGLNQGSPTSGLSRLSSIPTSQMEGSLAAGRLDDPLAFWPQPIREKGAGSKSTNEAALSLERAAPARTFTSRALPLSFTFNPGAQLLSPNPAQESPEVPSGAEATTFNDSSNLSSPSEMPSPHHPQVGQAVVQSSQFMSQNGQDVTNYIVVATDQGVYYTTNISASYPLWEPLNNGLVITDDQNVYDLWPEPGNAEVKALWTATASGIWRNANPFSSGKWKKLPIPDPPNDWNDPTHPTAEDVTFVKIVGVGALTIYALAEWQEPNSSKYRGWLLKSEDIGQSWTWSSAIGSPSNLIPNPGFENGTIEGWSLRSGSGASDFLSTDPSWVHTGSYAVGINSGGACNACYTALDFSVTQAGTYIVSGWYKQPPSNGWGSLRIDNVTIVNGSIHDKWVSGEISTNLSAGTHQMRLYKPYYAQPAYADDLSVVYSSLYEETRPLSISVAPDDTNTIYVAIYKEGKLYHQTYDASFSLVHSVDFGLSSIADIDNRVNYLATYAPVASGLGDTVYAFGRFDLDSQVGHLYESNDGAATFQDIGDPTWADKWLGDLRATGTGVLTAFANGTGMQVYYTINGGDTWIPGSFDLGHPIGAAWGTLTRLRAA
jgi:hypothetical protein